MLLPFIPEARKQTCLCKCGEQDRDDQKIQRELRERQHYHENLRTRGIQDAALRACSFEQSDSSNPDNIAIAKIYADTFMEAFYPQGNGLLLIIDDLGVERKSDFALENLFTVIDERYKSNKPLIITTNLSLEQMEQPTEMAHRRIYDRILEKCTPLAFDGDNKRKEKRQTNFAAAREQFAAAKRK